MNDELGKLEGTGRRVIKVLIGGTGESSGKPRSGLSVSQSKLESGTVIPRLTKIIRSGITFVSRNLR